MSARQLPVLLSLLLLVPLAIAATLLATESGSRWTLALAQRQLPALQVIDSRGSWLTGLDIQQLSWQSEALTVNAEDVRLQLELRSLFHSRLSVTSLLVDSVTINPGASVNDTKAPQAPLQLTDIALPVDVDLGEVHIRTLSWADSPDSTLHDFRVRATWSGSRVTLKQLSVSWVDGSLSSRGEMQSSGSYPLSLTAKIGLSQWQQPVDLQLGGSLRALSLHAVSAGDWPLQLDAELDLLNPALPLTATLSTLSPLEFNAGEQKLHIATAILSAEGDRQALTANAQISLEDPWFGRSLLEAMPRWQDGRLSIENLSWQLNEGRETLLGRCDSQPEGNWQCAGELRELPLDRVISPRHGSLSSNWQLSGNWKQPRAVAATFPNISGRLGETAVIGNLAINSLDGQQWQVNALELQAGSNHLQASGLLGTDNQFRASWQMEQLSELHPDWQGRIQGHTQIGGTRQQINARMSLLAENLQTPQLSLQDLHLTLDLVQGGTSNSEASLHWQGLRTGNLPEISGELALAGTQDSARWQLTASDALHHQLSARCQQQLTGAMQPLELQCSTLQLSRADSTQSLSLTSRPLRINWWHQRRQLDLADTCLYESSGNGKLCLSEAFTWRNDTPSPLAIRVEQMPVEWLFDLAPQRPDILPGSRLDADLTVSHWQPVAADGEFRIAPLSWRWPNSDSAETPARVETLKGSLQLREQLATLKLDAQSANLGALSAQLAVAQPTGQAQLSGQLETRNLQVSAFSWLWPADYQLTGSVDSRIHFSGTLAAPRFQGTARLSDASVETATLSEVVSHLNADIELDRNRIAFDARFRQNRDGGRGQAQGELRIPEDWRQWQLRSSLSTEHIQLFPLPDSSLIASSRLTLQGNALETNLKGRIDVDSADIRFKQLPPDIQRVSSDAEFVEQNGSNHGQRFYSDLTIACGEDCHLRGFGADVYLGGELRLQQQPGRTLSAQGTVKALRGRYRAYGQRLTVRRGHFIFRGPLDNPDIDLEAIRDMPEGSTITVGVNVFGPLQAPKATLFSEPEMPPTEQTFYLLTGKPPPTFESRTPMSAESALLAIGLAGTNERAAQVAERFGITDLQISGSTSEEGNEAQISGYLSPRLYVRYGSELREGTATVTLQYHLTRKLLLEAVTGFRQSLDLLYTFSVD